MLSIAFCSDPTKLILSLIYLPITAKTTEASFVTSADFKDVSSAGICYCIVEDAAV